MPAWLRIALGSAVTAGLCYGAWWIWQWAEREVKGTPVGDFKFFASVLAVFAALSAVQLVADVAGRLVARRSER